MPLQLVSTGEEGRQAALQALEEVAVGNASWVNLLCDADAESAGALPSMGPDPNSYRSIRVQGAGSPAGRGHGDLPSGGGVGGGEESADSNADFGQVATCHTPHTTFLPTTGTPNRNQGVSRAPFPRHARACAHRLLDYLITCHLPLAASRLPLPVCHFALRTSHFRVAMLPLAIHHLPLAPCHTPRTTRHPTYHLPHSTHHAPHPLASRHTPHPHAPLATCYLSLAYLLIFTDLDPDLGQVVWFGAVDALLPELLAGESHQHELSVAFLEPGMFNISIECVALTPFDKSADSADIGSGWSIAATIRIPHLERPSSECG